ncbi:phytanoyl-CoA dioxygenase family protein [Shimia abyssi]|uniref:Ectoine hydroxylase-related dioxygenase (Phytanoyl-CoA dioxygenase family) n=1 Tax=Shimia abyssi TaxID=1662395 RepID=A0A2P8FBU0_9RHOB|nr:phytanoyl-CoA dioxygenase family protein [Shimia abyssi]PSL19183.1 ectoine hydroxylase-related dioxygenase (phytanoyl-CoA dioxygenase family) [Shimia abyssi]
MTINTTQPNGFYAESACDLNDFKVLTEQVLRIEQVPHASDVQKNIAIYDMPALTGALSDPETRRALMAEWAWLLHSSAGAFVLKQAQPDHDTIDRATRAYEAIIAREKAAGGEGADHFAAAGNNDRIWNSLQKLCEEDTETYLRYFAAPAIDAAAEAWLGPNYQMTAQVNLVHPGGQAQQAHRDYHLGFQTADISATYPAHVHELSPLMTLQGGIAHCDMSIESGPTKLLPFSQLYRPGYAAWRRPDFRAYFEETHVQLPLEKGDAVFFSPALFHAAGENRSEDVHRMVNLLQVSSAFGRAMETVDRVGMCATLFAPLSVAWAGKTLTEAQLDAVIASTAEGYSFPTNLDRDPPVNGLAPETQTALLKRAVLAGIEQSELRALLTAQDGRKRA